MKNLREGYYSKIPNNLVIMEEEKQSKVKDIDEKVILIWDYLYTNTNREGIVRFTLEDMIIECGFKPNSRAGESNSKFKNILEKMQKHKLIEILELHNKANKISIAKIIEIDSKYFNLYKAEKELLLKEKDNLNLLKVYCLLKARMYRRPEDKPFTPYGQAETCFASYEDITLNTGVANAKDYIDRLVKLDLIRYKNAGVKVNKITNTKQFSRNTYALYQQGWEQEIDLSIAIYKNTNKEHYNFIEVDTNLDKRKIGGEKGYLVKKIKDGSASKKDKSRLEYLETILSATENTKENYTENLKKEIPLLCKEIIKADPNNREYIKTEILKNNIELNNLEMEQLQEIKEELLECY